MLSSASQMVKLELNNNATLTKRCLCYFHYSFSIWSQKWGTSICPGKWFTRWGEQPARRHRSLCEHVLQRLSLPACPPAWGQLGSRALWSEAPLGSADWLESHLPNRLAPCHQTMEKQRGLGGVGKRKSSYTTERRSTSRKGEKNVSARVCQMITIIL